MSQKTNKDKYSKNNGPIPTSMPSEEEIKRLCQEIQSNWTEDERKRRSRVFVANKIRGKSKLVDVKEAAGWTPPICKIMQQ